MSLTYLSFFFFLISGGRIDHGLHDGMAVKALTDGVAMNKAVAKALQIVNKGKFFREISSSFPSACVLHYSSEAAFRFMRLNYNILFFKNQLLNMFAAEGSQN